MKKVLIAAEIFEPDIGGPATYGKKIAEELTNRGFDVSLVCYSNKKEKDNYNFKITRVLRGRNSLSRYLKYFFTILKLGKDVDVIYAQGPVGSGLPVIMANFILKKKVIVKVVGDYAWEQARGLKVTDMGIDEFQNKNFGGKIGRLKNIESFVCKKASKVITPSNYLKNIVKGWGVPESQIIVVYNSATLPQVSRQESDSDIILSIARLVPWKGFSLLIDLIPELLKVNPKFYLQILGDGPDKEKLQQQIKDLNLEDKISIKLVDHRQRDEILSRTNLFVLNTGYEGLSHTILETFAAGVPVITTNIGGNPELIENGVNGILVEHNNKEEIKKAILELYANSELRQKFVIKSKEVLNKFTAERMINDTIKVLQG